jgi:ABC-type sugar transport system substrate-binding protein
MKFKLAMAFLAVFALTSTAGLASAQEKKTKTTHKKVRTITGCVSKGEDANEFKITSAKGGVWDLDSDAIKFSDHVGHTVTVTGTVAHPAMHGMKEDMKTEAKEHGMKKDATEHGHLTVTNLTMVSETCTK